MHSNISMKHRLTLTLLVLILAVGALSLAAQQSGQSGTSEETGTAQTEDIAESLPPQDDESETQTAPDPADIADTDPDATIEGATVPADVPAAEETEKEPFDYKSTEQISEDLSVSFPIDI
jgi:hypothetical protein